VLLSLMVGAVAAPTAVSAGFGPTFQVSGPTSACTPPFQVAIDADGDAVFAWTREFETVDGFPRFRVQARTRSAAGVFGPIRNVSCLSDFPVSPDLAIDDGGDAVIAWSLRPPPFGPLHAQFRALSAAGALGPIVNLSNVLPVQSPKVAMNSQGEAFFVWVRSNESQETSIIQARARSAAGVLGPIQRLSRAGQMTSPEVAANVNGEAVFTWIRQFGSDHLVQARRRSRTGALGLLHQNLGKVRPGNLPHTALAADGDAVITWTEISTSGTRVVMRTLSGADAVGPRQPISQGSLSAANEQIAMNAAGDAVFVFQQAGQDFRGRAKARFRSAAGVFTPTRTVSGPDARAVAGGIDEEGRSLFAWPRFVGAATRLEARTRSALGDFSPVRVLSSLSASSAQPSRRRDEPSPGSSEAKSRIAGPGRRFAPSGLVKVSKP
jgi:hypothetical protein